MGGPGVAVRGSPRFALTVVSLIVLVAVAIAGCAGTGRTPAALVGRWKGGSHSNGPWYYEFSVDGGYRTWPQRSSGTLNEGTVVVVDDRITFSNGGAPVTMTWSTTDGELVLDGQRYVRV